MHYTGRIDYFLYFCTFILNQKNNKYHEKDSFIHSARR